MERGPLTHGPRSAPRSTAKFRKLGLARASSSEPARPIPVGSLVAAQQSSCDARPRERTLGSRSRPAVLHRLLLLLSWFSFPPPSSSFLFRCFFFPYQPWRDDTPCSFVPSSPSSYALPRSLLAFFFLFFFFFSSPGPGVQPEAARQETTIALFSQEREKKTGREGAIPRQRRGKRASRSE